MCNNIFFKQWIQIGAMSAICIILILSLPAAVLALQPGQISLAAEICAGQRAVAAMHPDEKVRNPDYLAQKFLSDEFWHYSHYSRDFKTSMLLINTFRLGAYYYVNARTKHIDRLLAERVNSGAEQVVILGAGLDSRPYRFARHYPDVTFFELDHPDTSAYKQATARRILGRLPPKVTFVPIDFIKADIADTLKGTGYDPEKRTFFIWEGVTFYIPQEAIDHTLAFIASHSAPGSTVVFDYLPEAAFKSKAKRYQRIRRMSYRMGLEGEPMLSGLPADVGAAQRYVENHGLRVLSNFGHQELKSMYLMGSNGKPDGQPSPFYRIVHAQVAPSN